MFTRSRPTAARQSKHDTRDTRERLRTYTTCDRVKYSSSRHKNAESWRGNETILTLFHPIKGGKSEAHWTHQQLAPSHWRGLRSLIQNQRHLTAKVPHSHATLEVHTHTSRTHRSLLVALTEQLSAVLNTFVERLQPPLSPIQSAHPECPLPRAVH